MKKLAGSVCAVGEFMVFKACRKIMPVGKPYWIYQSMPSRPEVGVWP